MVVASQSQGVELIPAVHRLYAQLGQRGVDRCNGRHRDRGREVMGQRPEDHLTSMPDDGRLLTGTAKELGLYIRDGPDPRRPTSLGSDAFDQPPPQRLHRTDQLVIPTAGPGNSNNPCPSVTGTPPNRVTASPIAGSPAINPRRT